MVNPSKTSGSGNELGTVSVTPFSISLRWPFRWSCKSKHEESTLREKGNCITLALDHTSPTPLIIDHSFLDVAERIHEIIVPFHDERGEPLEIVSDSQGTGP